MIYACGDWRYIAHVNPTLYAENMYYGQRVEATLQAAMRAGKELPPIPKDMGETMEGRLRHLANLGYTGVPFEAPRKSRVYKDKHALVYGLYS